MGSNRSRCVCQIPSGVAPADVLLTTTSHGGFPWSLIRCSPRPVNRCPNLKTVRDAAKASFRHPAGPTPALRILTLHAVNQLPCASFKVVRQSIDLHSPPPSAYSRFSLNLRASVDVTLHLVSTIKRLKRCSQVTGLTLGVIRCTSAKKWCAATHYMCPISDAHRGTQ